MNLYPEENKEIAYITGYRFAMEDISEKIKKWFEEDYLEPMYIIAKTTGYIEGILDALKIRKEKK